jgi:hypothetical protein
VTTRCLVTILVVGALVGFTVAAVANPPRLGHVEDWTERGEVEAPRYPYCVVPRS